MRRSIFQKDHICVLELIQKANINVVELKVRGKTFESKSHKSQHHFNVQGNN